MCVRYRLYRVLVLYIKPNSQQALRLHVRCSGLQRGWTQFEAVKSEAKQICCYTPHALTAAEQCELRKQTELNLTAGLFFFFFLEKLMLKIFHTGINESFFLTKTAFSPGGNLIVRKGKSQVLHNNEKF